MYTYIDLYIHVYTYIYMEKWDHISQSRPVSGLGFRIKILKPLFPFRWEVMKLESMLAGASALEVASPATPTRSVQCEVFSV